jgi:Acyl-coenzyme A oxidase N-terminal
MHSLNNKAWLPSTINISLKEERQQIDFNQEQLTNIIWGGKEKLDRHRNLMQIFANDPILKNDHYSYEFSREESMERQYQKIARIYKLNIEELTYKNIFHYVILIGTVCIHQIFIPPFSPPLPCITPCLN